MIITTNKYTGGLSRLTDCFYVRVSYLLRNEMTINCKKKDFSYITSCYGYHVKITEYSA